MTENKKARWIWYRGDFEIYHSMKLHLAREERGHMRPVPWDVCMPYANVTFRTDFTAEKDTEITVKSNGNGRVILYDGNVYDYKLNTPIKVKKGTYTIVAEVSKPGGLPSVFVDSEYLITDNTWTCNNLVPKNTINAGDEPYYFDENITPEEFIFEYERVNYISKEKTDGGVLYDFGKELCAKLVISGANPKSEIFVCYGESKEESLATGVAVLQETVFGKDTYVFRPRAFRYVYISGAEDAEIYADYEYLPITDIGDFSCENEMVNKIWDVCSYTFHLNSREFFLDGIKRDHWVWGGDAYQSFMVDACLFFDMPIIKRTITALVGKPPFEHHINNINDYTLYIIISLFDYYYMTGDKEFVSFMFERIKGLYDFTVSRLDENGFVCKRDGDWIFIDWSDMDKEGPVAAEQILMWKAHLSMADLAEILGKDSFLYKERAEKLYENIYKYFWNEDKGVFIDGFTSGKNNVTRHANIFAILYDFADEKKKKSIVKNVLENENVTKITTPYFSLYELMARCKMGDVSVMQKELESYWGGMIKLGATSIWEEYDPKKKGAEHYNMYDSSYEKSLCHAWGAGPILLLSRYVLGVEAKDAAYKSFEIHPNPGEFSHIKGTVPLPTGKVDVELCNGTLSVLSTKDGGYILHGGEKINVPAGERVVIEKYLR